MSTASAPSSSALIVVAHPDPVSLNHALARAVAETWSELGIEISLRDLHAEGRDDVDRLILAAS
ncbi:MAG TPA: NAD(P)H-dependent oxidoreductase [Microvirga sp.]|nr:NAD(P)H-dependent oxidoreductase [Microvirga sp.]